ncbi:ELWxxDGT repeat protein [Zunongwangia atlantica]|uniref:Glycosyl hydrolase n=1 Tax=Zunongwangia atlantica 22II14-10F7 TaxID=1185767 RepID=A0A1Y1SZI5_9FLAO|nr:ELWxxDGT repeat protein [Zunongwangia atlantica]ORL44176.1 glycosyl hydrolase [Zunongwangia atlantica 22II14-10F7]
MKKHHVLFAVLLFAVCSYKLIAQQYIGTFNSIDEMVSLGNTDYFLADDGIHGKELWKTDGTPNGTSMLKDILEGTYGSDPENLFVFKNHIYFSANNGITGHELWRSDGTIEGTVLVKDIHPSHRIGSNPKNFTVYQGELYFTASNEYINGSQKLYKTDGTSNGTKLVYADNSSSFVNLTVANDLLYFSNKQLLYKYDSVTNETEKMDIDEYYSVAELNSFHNELYFITHTSYRGNIRLYRITQSEDIILLKEFNQDAYGDQDIYDFTQIEELVFFSKTNSDGSSNYENTLWKTDGTSEGTVLVKKYGWQRHYSGSRISNFIEYNGKLYFNGGGENAYALMESDGTAAGTFPVYNQNDINIDKDGEFIVANNLIHFSSGRNIWTSNGTSENTKKFSGLRLTRDNTGEQYYFKSNGDIVYFRAEIENSPNEYDNRKVLYSTEISGQLEVAFNNRALYSGESKNFISKIDSVSRFEVTLKNKGNKSLAFSQINISGNDFYLDGKDLEENLEIEPSGFFPKSLEKGETATFTLFYYPQNKGHQNATLSIQSSDSKNPEFNLILKGFAKNSEVSTNSDAAISLKKEIQFKQGLIELSNNSFSEKTYLGSIISAINIFENENNNYNFKFVSGKGDANNKAFKIEGNKLKLEESFNRKSITTLSLRIAAENQNTGDVFEEIVVLNIEKESILTSPTENCEIQVENLDFDLNDIIYLKEQEFIAVGTEGLVLKTYNAGQTWEKKHTGDYRSLFQVEFPDERNGYALGDQIILKSEDAGESWFELEFPAKEYPYPRNITFIDAEKGFLFSENGKILVTNNGGKDWYSEEINHRNLTKGLFINETTGFLLTTYSNQILKTIDSGNSWNVLELNSSDNSSRNFIDIFFIDQENGFLLNNSGDVYSTTDSGITWEQTSSSIARKPSRIKFANENTGYITSSEGLFKTEDRGVTWNLVFDDYRINNLSFALSDNDEYALIVDSEYYGSNNAIARKAPNKEWEIISRFTDASRNPITNFENNIGVLFTEEDAYISKDGGTMWQTMNKPNDGYMSYTKIRKGIIYVLGRYNFHKSSDFGKTWEKLGAIDGSRFFRFINDETIIALGNAEMAGILKSTNRGASWDVMYEDAMGPGGLSFNNEKEGIAVGFNGIIKTEDGGSTWKEIETPEGETESSSFLYSAEFYEDIALAGAQNGILYKSIDRGKNWNRVFTTIEGTINFLHANSEENWLAVSGNTIYKSEDAGESWKEIFHLTGDLRNFYADGELLYGSTNEAEIFKFHKNNITPGQPSYIQGDTNVVIGTSSTYSVPNQTGINYNWEIDGDQEIFFKGNTAKIDWNSPGLFTIKVTPQNNCSLGNPRSIKVRVIEANRNNPVITGPETVQEFSTEKTYQISKKENSKYQWFAKGATKVSSNNNIVSIDWGLNGKGKVQVIETDTINKIRYIDELNINIEKQDFEAPILKPTNATCRDKNNGKLEITTNNPNRYTAVISSNTQMIIREFDTNIEITDLRPGDYSLCLTMQLNNRQECYEFQISEPEAFEVSTSSYHSLDNMTVINMSGGIKPYSVFLNGTKVAHTNKNEVIINSKPGDFLEVSASGECSISFGERINSYLHTIVYPNPTYGPINVSLEKTTFSNMNIIPIEIYSLNGNLISEKNIKPENNILRLNINDLSAGIYFLKLGNNTNETIKIIKK